MIPLSSRSRRSGYTLIELLVALAIILGVMSLVVAIYPSYSQREDLYRSSDLLRNTIMRARQWALRDKATTGVQIGSSAGNLGATITLVQSPPILYGSVTNLRISSTASPDPVNSPTAVSLQKFDGTNWTAPGPYTPDLSSGDYLVSDVAALINGAPVKNTNHWVLPLANSTAISTTGQTFQILRKVAALQGEPVITLSPSVFIDLSGASTDGLILFNAKGQCSPQNVGVLTIRVAQTDNGSPLPSNHTTDPTTADNVITNYAINETTIKIDASTGISKVLGK